MEYYGADHRVTVTYQRFAAELASEEVESSDAYLRSGGA